MTDPNYVDPAEFAQWEAERQAAIDADNDCRREIQQRTDMARIDPLLDRIEDLEVRAYFAEEFLKTVLERWREARHERGLLRLIVMEYEGVDTLRWAKAQCEGEAA